MESLDPSQRKKLDPFYNAAGGGSKGQAGQAQAPVIYTTLGTTSAQGAGGGGGGARANLSVKDRINKMYNRMMRGGGGSSSGVASSVSDPEIHSSDLVDGALANADPNPDHSLKIYKADQSSKFLLVNQVYNTFLPAG